MGDPVLEVVVLHAADAEAAVSGGADRLVVCAAPAEIDGGLSPDVPVVSAICRTAGPVPVRVVLRADDVWVASGAVLTRLQRLAESYAAAGASGYEFGFLTPDNDLDTDTIRVLAQSVVPAPWTLSRVVDHVVATDRAWRDVGELGADTTMDQVATAGSVRGVEAGIDELIRRAREFDTPEWLLAGPGLTPEHVPWLLGAGVSAFAVDTQVRAGRSWTKGYVDTGLVRSWRLLLDAEAQRRPGSGRPVS